MKLIIQRVLKANISTNEAEPVEIGEGLVCLFGVCEDDEIADADKLARKAANLRIFDDADGKMNISAAERGLDIIAAPNFTLYGDTKKGLRPSFDRAAKHELAKPAFELFVEKLKSYATGKVVCGEFGAYMKIDLVNDGPVTIIMDTKDWER